jgi:outer membrane receptor protein involved in Fe transport
VFDGKHRLQLDYFGSYSQARRDDPALREMLYLADDDCDLQDVESVCNGVADVAAGAVGDQIFMGLVDDNANGALNFEIPFDQWSGLRTSVKVGAWAEGKWREFGVRRFNYQIANGLTGDVPEGTGNIINDSTIGSGVGASQGGTEPFVLRELTRPLDSYRASQKLYAGYGMLTLPFAKWVRISGGARVEASKIVVQPFDPFARPDDEAPDCAVDTQAPECLERTLDTFDVLPALSIIFSPKLKEKLGTMNVRLMGSRTLARPEFRELAPFQFTNFVGGFTVIGNPDLVQTRIWNAEARWEWFPKPTEVVAVTGFYKYFDAPIEQVANASTPPIQSFVNAKGATNVGAEVELRKSLGFLVKKDKPGRRVARMFGVGANFAYVYSRVQLLPPCYRPGEAPPDNVPNPEDYVEREGCKPALEAVTSRERALQGQSPYVLNAFVDYDNQDTGTFVRVIFNTFGRRIYAVSTQGLPDIYEESRPGLDVVFSQRLFAIKRNRDGDLRHELRLDAGATNLINPPLLYTQGEGRLPTHYARQGANFSLGLSWAL